MRFLSKHSIILFGLVLTMTAAPGKAQAESSVHIDAPIISVGWHDNHHRKHYKRSHRSHKLHHRKHYRNYNRYRNYDRYYRNDRRRSDRYYDNRRRYNNYYYGDRDRYYDRDRRYRRSVEVCPLYGYSRYRDRNRSCERHKDHYHCG